MKNANTEKRDVSAVFFVVGLLSLVLAFVFVWLEFVDTGFGGNYIIVATVLGSTAGLFFAFDYVFSKQKAQLDRIESKLDSVLIHFDGFEPNQTISDEEWNGLPK